MGRVTEGTERAGRWCTRARGELSLQGLLLAEALGSLWKPQAGDTQCCPLLEGGALGGALTLLAWASLQPGESWPDPGNPCLSHECEKHQDGLVVVTTKQACPPLSCPAVSSRSPPAQHFPGWTGLGSCGQPHEMLAGCYPPVWGTVHSCVRLAWRPRFPICSGCSHTSDSPPFLAQDQARLSEDGCCLLCPQPKPQNREWPWPWGRGEALGVPG